MFYMKKVLAILVIATILTLAQTNFEGMSNVAKADFNGKLIAVDDQGNPFQSFFRLFNKGNDNNNSHRSDFMLKGTISASSTSSLTIDNRVINIDSSVTGNVKIVGNDSVGSYAMVQGIIQNGNYYATKIVVDQRNKQENKENNEENTSPTPTVTVTPTLTPTPSVSPTVTLTPTPTGTESASIEAAISTNLNSNIQQLINILSNFLTSLGGSISKI